MTETTEQHAARLGAYIDYFQIQSGIIIFSDLISLEELRLSLIQQLQIPFILVGCTSVNTVSSFGKALLCHNSHFFETLTPQYSFPCYIHQPKQREKILLAVCPTGGVSKKLKNILNQSIPQTVPLRVIDMPYDQIFCWKAIRSLCTFQRLPSKRKERRRNFPAAFPYIKEEGMFSATSSGA